MRTPLVMRLGADAHNWGKPEPLTRLDACSVRDLCEQAGIPCRAFGHQAELKMIVLKDSENDFLVMEDNGPFYSVGKRTIPETDTTDLALRILEVMAYTFREYYARERLNFQGYFAVPPDAWRPS